MDCRYESVSASPSSSDATNSCVPSPIARTGTGVASATPVRITRTAPITTPARLALPDTLRLIEVDRARVEGDRRADRGRVELHLLGGGVDDLEIALVVEDRREDRANERRVEFRVHYEQILHARHRRLRDIFVRSRGDLARHV